MKLAEFRVFDESGFTTCEGGWEEATNVVTEAVREVFRVSAPLRRPKDTGGVFLMVSNIIEQPDLAEDEDEEQGRARLKRERENQAVEITDGITTVDEIIGDPVVGQIEQYRKFAREKASRLLWRYAIDQHYGSWQSRDHDCQQYAGAIITRNSVLSFSGCSELMDEAIVNCVALITGLHNQTDAEYITSISGNELFPKLMELVNAQLV